ncbi:MAG: Hsp70 family protein, partial [Planctomyces sp.]
MKSAQAAKYVVGIDLGTTNSVLSYADISDPEWTVKVLAVPQLVAPQTVEPRQSLPSFHLAATESENTGGLFRLLWSEESEFAVGTMARDLSAEYPERTIGAAKSWLCHSRVDRRSPILPWQAPEHVGKISPVTASQRYLQHLIAAWNQAFPDSPMADQSVVLTVPASFDASARELTREAAAAAGLPEDCLLLEEPQAAT